MVNKKPMMPKPKAAMKPKMAKPPAVKPAFFNQAGKPDAAGLFDKDGFQVRFDKDVKKDSFTKQAKSPADTDAAKKLGYKR